VLQRVASGACELSRNCHGSHCVVVYRGVLQCAAVCCSVLHLEHANLVRTAMARNVLQCVAVWCSVLQCVAPETCELSENRHGS